MILQRLFRFSFAFNRQTVLLPLVLCCALSAIPALGAGYPEMNVTATQSIGTELPVSTAYDSYQGYASPPAGFEPAVTPYGYEDPYTQSASQKSQQQQQTFQQPGLQPLTPPAPSHQQPHSQQYSSQHPQSQPQQQLDGDSFPSQPYVPSQAYSPVPSTGQLPQSNAPGPPIYPPAYPDAALLGFAPTGSTTIPENARSLGGPAEPAAPPRSGETEDQRNIILDVKVVGNGQIPLDKIRPKVKSRPGRPFNELTLEEDKRALTQTGWFTIVQPNIYRSENGITILFELIERPLLHYVKFVGNKAYDKKKLLEESMISPGDALDPMSIMQAKTRIEDFYKSGGHHKIHVEVLSGDRQTDRGAVFLISEGGKQRILKTEFIGARSRISGARLKTQIESKPGWVYYIGGEFTREKLDADVEKLTAYYRNLGYFFAKIDRDFEECRGYTGLGEDDGWVKVRFIIEEGPCCKVASINFVGNNLYTDRQLLEEMKKIKIGKYYNQMGLETDIMKIKDKYGRTGRVFTEVVPDYVVDSPRPNEGTVDLTIKVRESRPCRFGTVVVDIFGNDGGKESYSKMSTVLNRSPKIRPGKPIDTAEIRNTERRLKYSQLFNSNPTQGYLPEVILELDEKDRAHIFETELAEAPSGITRGQQPGSNGSPEKLRKVVSESNEPAANSGENNSIRGLIRDQLQKTNRNLQEFDKAEGLRQQQNRRPFFEEPQAIAQAPNVILGQSGRSIPSLPSASSTTSYSGSASVYPTTTPPSPTTQPTAAQPSAGYVSSGAQYGSVNGTTIPTTPEQTAVQQAAASQYGTYNPAPTGTVSQVAATTNQTAATPYTYSQTMPANPVYPNAAPAPPYGSNYTPTPAYDPNSAYGAPTYAAPSGYAQSTPLIPPPQPYIPGANNPSTQAGGLMDPVMPGSPELQDKTYTIFNPKPEPLFTVPARIRVMEAQTGQLMMSVGVNSDSGLVARFQYKEDNFSWNRPPSNPFRLESWRNAFRGGGERFKIEAMPGTQYQRYEMAWENPHFLDTDISLGLSGFYYNRIYTDWREQRVGGSASLGYKLTQDLSISGSYKGEGIEVYDPITLGIPDLDRALGFNPLHTFGLRLDHDTRDNPNMATEGHLISLKAEQILGGFQYPRLSIDARQYFMLHERPDTSGRWVLGFRSAASWTDIDTPIFERYYAGGFTTIRGFDYRGVSPRYGGIPIGGNFEFYNSAELMFPISADDMIRGVVFLDTGCVQDNIKDWNQKYRVAPGFGIRITIPFMGPAPIAFDFAFPISKDPSDDVNIFSFYVGFMR